MSRELVDGWDTFNRNCGTVEHMDCKVCQSRLSVKRGVEDFRNSRDAMGGLKTKFDVFWCPHSNHDWHIQARKILQEAEATASGKLERMLQEEAEVIVARKKCTK